KRNCCPLLFQISLNVSRPRRPMVPSHGKRSIVLPALMKGASKLGTPATSLAAESDMMFLTILRKFMFQVCFDPLITEGAAGSHFQNPDPHRSKCPLLFDELHGLASQLQL